MIAWFDLVFHFVLAAVLVVALASLALVVVVSSNQADCLEAGYPLSAVTWDFKKYCMKLEGSVVVKVTPTQNAKGKQ